MISIVKRIFKIKRYFICSYAFDTGSRTGNGSILCDDKNGCYPNREEIEKYLKFKSIAIICMIELSKKDYLDYSRTQIKN